MQNTQQQGLIKAIILIVIALLILKFGFNFDVFEYINGEDFKNFVSFVWRIVLIGWGALIDWIISFLGFIKGLFN